VSDILESAGMARNEERKPYTTLYSEAIGALREAADFVESVPDSSPKSVALALRNLKRTGRLCNAITDPTPEQLLAEEFECALGLILGELEELVLEVTKRPISALTPPDYTPLEKSLEADLDATRDTLVAALEGAGAKREVFNLVDSVTYCAKWIQQELRAARREEALKGDAGTLSMRASRQLYELEHACARYGEEVLELAIPHQLAVHKYIAASADGLRELDYNWR